MDTQDFFDYGNPPEFPHDCWALKHMFHVTMYLHRYMDETTGPAYDKAIELIQHYIPLWPEPQNVLLEGVLAAIHFCKGEDVTVDGLSGWEIASAPGQYCAATIGIWGSA